ncbi:MAG: PDZ domain-containing protein [Thermoanaerobaculia bacterium]|nr:PDZ domain-containing protein [Thermoanaerobaculia bacterium]
MHRRNYLILVIIAVLMAPSAMSDQPRCKADADECAEKIRQILSHKKYLGVTLVESRWGTVIKEVAPDSPAARAGLRPNDRIIGIDNHDCTGADPQEVKRLLMPIDGEQKEIVRIVVSRLGEVHRLRARLGLMPEEKIEKIVQRHIETAHREDSEDEDEEDKE